MYFFSNFIQKIIIRISIVMVGVLVVIVVVVVVVVVVIVILAKTRNRITEGSVCCKGCRLIMSYKCLIKGRFVTSVPFHFGKHWMTISLDKDRGYFVIGYHIYSYFIDTIL